MIHITYRYYGYFMDDTITHDAVSLISWNKLYQENVLSMDETSCS